MTPSIVDGDILGIDTEAYNIDLTPDRGDIVMFSSPSNPDLVHTLRVIGLPGEEIVIDNQNVSINGTQLEEPYVDVKAQYQGRWVMLENEYFILGDNRQASADSHLWGGVHIDSILGKAAVVCQSEALRSCDDLQ